MASPLALPAILDEPVHALPVEEQVPLLKASRERREEAPGAAGPTTRSPEGAAVGPSAASFWMSGAGFQKPGSPCGFLAYRRMALATLTRPTSSA